MGLLPIPSPRGSVHSQSEVVEKWSAFLGKMWLHKKKSMQHVKITHLRKLWEEAPNQIASDFLANHKSRESNCSQTQHHLWSCTQMPQTAPPVPCAETPVLRNQYLTIALWEKAKSWKTLSGGTEA